MQNSSVEGVFAPQRSTHPFRIIETDAISIQSMTSLGRVGRILAGTIDASSSNTDKDTHSTNMSTNDWNVASTSNSIATTAAPQSSINTASIEQKPKTTSSNNVSNSSSSNESSSNKIILQGKCQHPTSPFE